MKNLYCILVVYCNPCVFIFVSTSTKECGYTVREREDSRLTGMMLTIFLCFCVCFLPLMLVNVADDNIRFPWIHVISSIMAWASSVINPFIYAASNRSYRVAYYKLLASIKFWGQPMSPIASKSMGISKGSRDISGCAEKRSISNGGIGQPGLTKPSPLDMSKDGKLAHL